MSGGTAPPLSKLAETPPPRRPSRHDGFIDKRLRQTRRQVKSADLWAGLIILAGGTLLYLLAAVVVDRWLIPGGLGFGGRLLLFVALIAAAAAYLALWMVPLVARRINPVFAAYAIEQGWPSLKNSLINLLYLRRERRETQQDELAKGIYRALERKAAADLAQIPPEATVDRSHVIRLACLLAGVLLVCCLYLAVWPKTTMVSFRRVIWPWAEVPPPTRVTIDDVQPGDAVAYQGDVLTVSAVVDGLDDDDQVALYYTTADGQCVDQAVPLTRPKGAYRHSCELPPGRLGLQQNVQYYLAAGDCRTRPFGLEVQTALSIQVDRVEYDYPDYTGIPNRVDRRVADLRAVEGTEVTLRATASQLIDRAAVEMDCDPRHALKMTVEDSRTASARFNLSMSRNDPTRPEHESYQLRVADLSGLENRRPIRRRIEVIPDRPPEIRFVEPPPERVQLPEDGVLELRVRAEDPDFALRRVALRAERDERGVLIPPLLEAPRPGPPHPDPFETTYLFEPARLGLKAGDEVIYWAEAQDNKEPVAGQTETARRWITVLGPDRPRPKDERPDPAGQPPDERPKEEQDQGPAKPDQPRQDNEGRPEEDQEQARPPDEQPDPAEKAEPSPADRQDQQDQEPSAEKQPGPKGADAPAAGGRADSQPSESQPGAGADSPGQQASNPQQDQPGAGTEPGTRADQAPSTGADQPADQQPGQPSQPREEPIDGSVNPGDAFDQILAYLDEQQAADQAGGTGADPSAQGKQPPQQDGTGASGSRGDEDQEVQKVPDNAPGEAEPGDPGQEGEGAQAKGPGRPNEEEPSDVDQQSPDGQGGDPQDTKGPGGAGRPSGDQTGSPSPQEANQPRDKHLGPGDQRPEPAQDNAESAQSPSNSPKESDSQGDTAGDRSGGGEEGGGQRSPQPGVGTGGSHMPSDQGASEADEQGEGETGSRPGDQVQADQPTGRQASQGEGPGQGTRTQPGGQGPNPPPGQPNVPRADGTGGVPQPGSTQGQQADARQPGSPAPGNPMGGGQPGSKPQATPPPQSGVYHGDDPNLEYAKERTALALEYLKDQVEKQSPDQELLDRLGWTKEDLEAFYRQWDQMRREAARRGAGGVRAREELDKAVRSLGLRPGSTELGGTRAQTDGLGNLKQGISVDPPPDWSEAYEAFQRGLGRGEN